MLKVLIPALALTFCCLNGYADGESVQSDQMKKKDQPAQTAPNGSCCEKPCCDKPKPCEKPKCCNQCPKPACPAPAPAPACPAPKAEPCPPPPPPVCKPKCDPKRLAKNHRAIHAKSASRSLAQLLSRHPAQSQRATLARSAIQSLASHS